MALRVQITAPARRDLLAIFDYLTQEAGARAAEGVRKRLETAVERLPLQAEAAAADPVLGPGRRRIVVRPYLIVYEVRPDDVRVLRVVHGARDLPALFGG